MTNQLTLPPGTPTRSSFAPLLIGLSVVLVGAGLWQLERSLRPDAAEREVVEEENTNDEVVSEILAVGAQTAGSVVTLENVNVPPPGVWAVVAQMRDGMIWSALGATRVRDTTANVRIELLRPALSGTEYAVVLYRDDGDEIFELRGDSAYIDYLSGEPVTASFTAH